MKIGKATVPRTAICTSDEHTIVVRGRDLSKELIGKVSFVEHFFLLLVGRLPSRRRGGGAQRDAGGDRRARPGAERAGGAHDLRRRARRDAGRGRRRHPRLRLGGARLVRDRGPHVRRDRRQGRSPARPVDARRARGDAGLARRGQVDPGLRPSAAQGARRARRRAVRRSRARPAPTCASSPSPRRSRRCMPEVLGKPLKLNVSGAIPAVLLGAGFPVAALQGRADPRAHRRPDRPPVRGDRSSRSASPCRTRRRARWSTTATCRGLRRASERPPMSQVLHGIKVVEQGTFITGPAAGDAARRPRRRRRQGRAARHRRPVPRLQGRPLQPALPDLQPQQAQHRARHQEAGRPRGARRAGRRRRRLHPELPPRRGREARRRREAPARAQPAPRLLLDQRLRPDRPGRATGRPTTRWRRRRAASSACWSIPRTRASSARRSPIR